MKRAIIMNDDGAVEECGLIAEWISNGNVNDWMNHEERDPPSDWISLEVFVSLSSFFHFLSLARRFGAVVEGTEGLKVFAI